MKGEEKDKKKLEKIKFSMGIVKFQILSSEQISPKYQYNTIQHLIKYNLNTI